MQGFAVLLGFYLLGAVLHTGLQLPVPANVIGLILFTASLFLGWVRVERVEEASRFLIRHMLLLFTPFVVGTIVFFGRIAEEAIPLLVSLFASTFGVLLITGWSVKWMGSIGGTGRTENNKSSLEEGEKRHDASRADR